MHFFDTYRELSSFIGECHVWFFVFVFVFSIASFYDVVLFFSLFLSVVNMFNPKVNESLLMLGCSYFIGKVSRIGSLQILEDLHMKSNNPTSIKFNSI